ncbi:MAG: zf-HC2 domain-containing protein [Terriglobia bacterium]
MMQKCIEIRSHFSDYLDDRCEREAVRSVRSHLSFCASCREELERMQTVQAELQTLPRRRVPPELALRLRVRISHELHRNLPRRFGIRFENALQPLLLPASGGVLTAIVFFVLIMGTQFVPLPTSPDVPLGIYTPPRVRALAPINFDSGDQSVVLLTQIDAAGRVMSYKVLSGQLSPQLSRDVDRIIYFSLFDPATAFGKPTDGQVVLSLRCITVRG